MDWFVICFKRARLLVLASAFLSPVVNAQAVLTLWPTTCVTLQEGRQCHAQVQIQWQLEQTAAVCLYLDEKLLQCWAEASAGEWQWSFADTRTRSLSLRKVLPDGHPAEILATGKVEVSWVQDTHKKRLWRRF